MLEHNPTARCPPNPPLCLARPQKIEMARTRRPAGASGSTSVVSKAEDREREREQLSSIWGGRSEKRGLAPSKRTVVSAPPKPEGEKEVAAGVQAGDDVDSDAGGSDQEISIGRQNPKPSAKVTKARKQKQDQARSAKLVLPIPPEKDRLDVMKALVKAAPSTVVVKPQASTGITDANTLLGF